MVLAKSCGITSVCAALALQTGASEGTLTQRLREWCYDAKDKKGVKRQTLEVTTCFAPLLAWVLSLWPAQERHLALALYRAVRERDVSRLCHSGRLENRGGGRKRLVATALERTAHASSCWYSDSLDGDCPE